MQEIFTFIFTLIILLFKAYVDAVQFLTQKIVYLEGCLKVILETLLVSEIVLKSLVDCNMLCFAQKYLIERESKQGLCKDAK